MPKIRVWETSPDRTLRRASSESASLRRRHAAARSEVRSGPARPRPSPANWRGLSLRRAACGGSRVFTALRSVGCASAMSEDTENLSVRRLVYPRGYGKNVSPKTVVSPGIRHLESFYWGYSCGRNVHQIRDLISESLVAVGGRFAFLHFPH